MGLFEHIADSPHRVNQLGLERVVHFRPQRGARGTSTTFVSLSKFMSQTCSAISVRRQHLAHPPRQQRQQREFLGVRSMRVWPPRHAALQKSISRSGFSAAAFAGWVPAASIVRTRASNSEKRERLDEIVVRASSRPLHPVLHRSRGGQEQHRREGPSAQVFHDRPSIPPRKHHVQDDQVVGAAVASRMPSSPVGAVSATNPSSERPF